jgi:hypothetical protein
MVKNMSTLTSFFGLEVKNYAMSAKNRAVIDPADANERVRRD